MDNMASCFNCGSKISKYATECPKCGSQKPTRAKKTCIECGSTILEGDEKCQHCGTDRPYGVKCPICRKIDKKSNLVASAPKGSNFKTAVCHQNCVETITQLGETCFICNASIASTFIESCSNCGHPFKRRTCWFCNYPVQIGFRDFYVELENICHLECKGGSLGDTRKAIELERHEAKISPFIKGLRKWWKEN